MNINFKKIAAGLILCAIVVGFSSCNRGYGCPYELKTVVKIVAPLVK